MPEVDRVEVLLEDLLLRPVLLDLVGERRLDDLAPQRARARPAPGFQRFLTSCWVIVEPPCASVPVQMLTTAARRHADRVDRAVLVVAPVLDRDDRVAHDRRDLVPVHEHAVLVGAQHAEHRLAVVGVDHAVRLLGELRDLELREILRQRRHEAVEERDEAEREPGQDGDREPRLAQAHAAPHRRRRGVVERERRWGRRRDCHGRRGSDAGLRVPAGHSTPLAVSATASTARARRVPASIRIGAGRAFVLPCPPSKPAASDRALRFAQPGRIV